MDDDGIPLEIEGMWIKMAISGLLDVMMMYFLI